MRLAMGRRITAGVVGVLGSAGMLVAEPAGAAEPHDLSRSDTYEFFDEFGSGETVTCTLHATNGLAEDGTGRVSAVNLGDEQCRTMEVYMTVSYVDATETPVSFQVSSIGGVQALVNNVGSDLAISYFARKGGGPGILSPTYRLPK